MNRQQIDLNPPFNSLTANTPNLQQIAAQGMRTGFIDLQITATLTLAGGPATAIRNSGSILGAITAIYFQEQGDQPVYLDPRILKLLTEAQSAREVPYTRLSALTDGATALREIVRIPFAWLLGVNAWRTSFVEKNPGAPTYVGIVPNLAATNIVITGGTAVITNFAVQALQVFDDAVADYRPYFRPRMTQNSQTVAGANTNLRMLLTPSGPVRQIVVLQDNGVTAVRDIITSGRLVTDLRIFLGPSFLPWDFLSARQAMEYGGNVYQLFGGLGAPGTTYGAGLVLNEQIGGLMSACIVPGSQGQNLRFEFNCLPSVTTGVVSSTITVGLVELQKVTGVTTPDQPFSMLGQDI